MDGSLTIV